MKIASREMNLLALTLGVVVLAATYLILEPRIREWSAFRAEREELQFRLERAEQLLESRPAVDARLIEFREGLPVFPEKQKVEAELMQSLEKLAAEQGLILTKRQAGGEREEGDLYETSISCDWQGDLSSLTRFLYAQQSLGVVSDVRELIVEPDAGRGRPPGSLKGKFTMDYAYRRTSGATETPAEPAGPPPAEEAAQP